jgi:hypothetical protein
MGTDTTIESVDTVDVDTKNGVLALVGVEGVRSRIISTLSWLLVFV